MATTATSIATVTSTSMGTMTTIRVTMTVAAATTDHSLRLH
jgi:hypothetical protein